MTNLERLKQKIQAMSVEEAVDFFCDNCECPDGRIYPDDCPEIQINEEVCNKCWATWLMSEEE